MYSLGAGFFLQANLYVHRLKYLFRILLTPSVDECVDSSAFHFFTIFYI